MNFINKTFGTTLTSLIPLDDHSIYYAVFRHFAGSWIFIKENTSIKPMEQLRRDLTDEFGNRINFSLILPSGL